MGEEDEVAIGAGDRIEGASMGARFMRSEIRGLRVGLVGSGRYLGGARFMIGGRRRLDNGRFGGS